MSIEKTHELALTNYEDFLETISSENIKKNNIIFKVRNIIYNLQHKCGDCKICGAGTDTFSVNVDGNVYPCFMMTDIEAHNIANTKMNKDEFMNSLKKQRTHIPLISVNNCLVATALIICYVMDAWGAIILKQMTHLCLLVNSVNF